MLDFRTLQQKISDEFIDWYLNDIEEELDGEVGDAISSIVNKNMDILKEYPKEQLIEIIDGLLDDGLGVLHQRIVDENGGDEYLEYYLEYLHKK